MINERKLNVYDFYVYDIKYGIIWESSQIFNQSETRIHCFFVPDWSKFETLPLKYRAL